MPAAVAPIPNQASDNAVDGPAARSAYHVSGVGAKIGIISDSFNATLNGIQDPADVAARQGYIPSIAGGTSAVHVISDELSSTNATNEGIAMAELVHETAPGARIDFASPAHGSADPSIQDFGKAVTALQNDGCTIIVDDLYLPTEPFFQTGSVLDTAIENFVSKGGDYFTAASNDGAGYYESAFKPIDVTLAGIGHVTAMNFSDTQTPTPFQNVTIAPDTPVDLALQWDQPFKSIGATSPGSNNSLGFYLLDSSGTIVAKATDNQVGGDPVQTLSYKTPVGVGASTSYKLAITLQNGTSAPGDFRLLSNDATVTFLDQAGQPDPKAGRGAGDVYGHGLLNDANTVGAAHAGTTPPVVEPYSEYGPGEIFFDNNGHRLATPQIPLNKVNFLAPAGSTTGVPGFAPFDGTSAAAPVAASIAALMLQENPALTPAQITADLSGSALAMDGAPNVGAGLVQADKAVGLAGAQSTGPLVLDTTTGQTVGAAAQPYSGPVAGLHDEYANVSGDNLAVALRTDNWFIRTGSGHDAIAAFGGTNVLDGGTGSSLLTGGSGTDTFFIHDGSATVATWSTVANFHAGDAITIFGIGASDPGMNWQDGQGTAGYAGLTLHASATGQPTASLTLTGFSKADLFDGRLSVSYGTTAASGGPYMYVHANS